MDENKKIKEESSALSVKKQIISVAVFLVLIALTFYAIISQNKDLTLAGFL